MALTFMVAIWTFWNRLPEIKWFGHFAIFGLFWMINKIVNVKAWFGEIWAKLEVFDEILTLNLVISTNFWRKFRLYLDFYHFWGFDPFRNYFWPNLAFLIFSGSGNPNFTHLHEWKISQVSCIPIKFPSILFFIIRV